MESMKEYFEKHESGGANNLSRQYSRWAKRGIKMKSEIFSQATYCIALIHNYFSLDSE